MPRLYIGRLSMRTTAKDIGEMFKPFGHIDRLDMKNGFAFIEYLEEQQVRNAVKEMDNREVDGNKIQVEAARGPRPNGPRQQSQRSEFRVRVEGLREDTSWQDLKDFARADGRLMPIFTHVRYGIGHVEYRSYEDVKEALRQLHDTELKGAFVKLYEDLKVADGDEGARHKVLRGVDESEGGLPQNLRAGVIKGLLHQDRRGRDGARSRSRERRRGREEGGGDYVYHRDGGRRDDGYREGERGGRREKGGEYDEREKGLHGRGGYREEGGYGSRGRGNDRGRVEDYQSPGYYRSRDSRSPPRRGDPFPPPPFPRPPHPVPVASLPPPGYRSRSRDRSAPPRPPPRDNGYRGRSRSPPRPSRYDDHRSPQPPRYDNGYRDDAGYDRRGVGGGGRDAYADGGYDNRRDRGGGGGGGGGYDKGDRGRGYHYDRDQSPYDDYRK